MPPLAPGDGVAEAEIAAAEARLGLKLPTVLREFYALVGRRKDINAVHNRLISLEESEVDQDRLVFYEENQAVVLWGVSIATQTTPTLQCSWRKIRKSFRGNSITVTFRSSSKRCCFAGGQRRHGIRRHRDGPSDDLATISDGWELVDLGGEATLWGNRVRMRDGQVLFIVDNDRDPQVYGGGRTRKDFLAVEKVFGISWDYSTLDEEPDEDDEERWISKHPQPG